MNAVVVSVGGASVFCFSRGVAVLCSVEFVFTDGSGADVFWVVIVELRASGMSGDGTAIFGTWLCEGSENGHGCSIGYVME